jgi:hypothetical protein
MQDNAGGRGIAGFIAQPGEVPGIGGGDSRGRLDLDPDDQAAGRLDDQVDLTATVLLAQVVQAGLDGGDPGDGDQRAAGAHQRRRAVEDLTADHVEHHVNLAGVVQIVGLQVQEGVHPQAEGGVAVRGPAGADHHGSHLAGKLHGD